MGQQQWMQSLAEYYDTVRRDFENQPRYRDMIVLFDIDGTILDHRKTIYDLLKRYDSSQGTSIFDDLRPEDIYVSQDHLDRLLEQFGLPEEQKRDIVDFYEEHRWTEDVILNSHRPYQGVMDVVRWFQLQPNTRVGLNTARPESLREETLESLNLIGEEHKVRFRNKLLHMNQNGWEDAIGTKVEGIRYFEKQDFRVVAMLDNEPANLSALSETEFEHDFLLLHAETCFDSDPEELPDQSLSGRDYGVTGFLQPRDDYDRIQFIWNRIDSLNTLTDFLNSSVEWGKLCVRSDPKSDELILRSQNFEQVPQRRSSSLTLTDALEHVSSYDKSIQLELNVDENKASEVVRNLKETSITEDNLGFRFGVTDLREGNFSEVLNEFPDAHREVPLDFMQKLILGSPEEARALLGLLREEGDVDRFSVQWQKYGKRRMTQSLQEWGYEVNLADIPGLSEFLGAEKLHPDSVTLTPTFTDNSARTPEIDFPEHVYG